MDGQTDDFTNDTGTTGVLEIGGTATGVIDFLDDQDWFAIELTEGDIVRFASDGSLSDIALVHYSGTFFIGFDQYDTNADQDIIIAQIFESGTYFIAVNGGSNASLGYTLSATLVEDDFADDATTTGLLEIDSTATGAVDYRNDTDWFAIDLMAGEAIRIASDSFNANLVLLDEFGNSVTFDYRDSDTNENVINAQVSDSGTYYVAVNSFNLTLDYALTVTALDDDFVNDTSTIGLLEVGNTIAGTINFSNDEDWIAIELTAGEAVRIASDSYAAGLILRDEFGDYVAHDYSDFDTNSNFLNAQIDESGTYYVSITSYDSTLDYTLTATLLEDDFVNNASTTGFLGIGGMASGAIDFRSDRDWFAIELTANEIVRIASDGSDANIILVDEFGIGIAQDQYDSSAMQNVLIGQIDETGTYYISVDGSSNASLDYTLEATLVYDDFSDDTSTTGVLEIGGTATGAIEFLTDVDWYAIELTAGEIYHFASDGSTADITLMDEFGNTVAFDQRDYSINQDVLIAQVDESGVYYIAVDGDYISSLDYTLTATLIEDDFSGDSSATGILESGGMATGAIDFLNDVDWFAVVLTAGEVMRFASDGSAADITLVDEFGNILASDYRDFSANQDVLIAQVTETGTYYIAVDGDNNSSLDYTLTATFIEDDFAGDNSTIGTLEVGGTTTGTIDFRGDEDFFAIELTAGEIVRIASDGTSADITLLDGSGNIITTDQREFSTNQDVLIAQVEENGTYYVVVDGDSNSILDYTITATALEDDFAGNNSTTGILEVGGSSATGTIDFLTDEDFFAIELTVGEIIRIASDGSSADITLRDEFGNIVASDYRDSDANQDVIIAQVDESGTYYISVDGDSNSTLDYTLTATAIEDDFTDDTSTTAVLQINGMVTGAIDFRGDEDWVAIELTAGEVVRIAADNRSANITLVDEFGNRIASDTFTDALISQVYESGTYYISVDSYDSTVDYTLTAIVPDDDFAAFINTTGVLEVGGTVAGTINFREDEDWFAIELTAGEIVQIFSNTTTPNISLRDEFGSVVEIDYRDYDTNENVLFAQVTESGTYYISVDTISSTVDYTLSAALIVDDFQADASTTGVLDIGGMVTGALNFRDDEDWFTITVSDMDSAIRLIVSNSDVALSIYDADGILVTSSTENFSINFPEIGTYYVVANPSSSISAFANPEDYTISSFVVETVEASLIVADTEIVDTVADETNNITYSLASDGTLIRYSNQTETLLPDLELGMDTSALSLSLDGQYLFAAQADLTVTENGAHEATVLRIDVETLETEAFSFEVTGNGYNITDIQTAVDGSLFVTTNYPGSGRVPFYNISGFDTTLSANAILQINQNSTLDISRDGQFLLLAQSNSSGYPLRIYSVEDGAIMASRDHGGYNHDRNAISGEAGLVAVAGYNEITLYDLGLNSVADLTYIFGTTETVHPSFSQNGEYLLLLNEAFHGDPSIAIVDTLNFEILAFVDLPQTISSIVEVDMSPDGLSLVITDVSGVHYLDLSDKLGVSVLEGTSNDDALTGTDFSDALTGLAGEDILEGGLGADILNGGNGFDTASYAGSGAAVIVDLAAGLADGGDATGDSLTSIENVSGSDYDDIITGDGRSNTLIGAGGNDVLEGGGGAGDILDGGAGIDTAVYINSTNRVDVNLLASTAIGAQATGDVLISIENLTGSSFGDTLRGAHDVNVLDGSSGNDILIGYNGDDHLLGGAGRDILNGGNGADIIDGGAGVDMARYNGSTAAVQIDLLAGTAAGGQAEGDTLVGIENLFGSNHDDTLSGDGNNNQIFGHNGDDALSAGGGISKLFGGSGADSFILGDGFAFVMDFVDDIDQLDVSAYGFATLAEALDNLDQVGAHARFRVGDDVLLVLNTDINNLMDDIFI